NTNLLITNQGGFNVMGHWAKGEFKAAGKVAEVDYGCILPGDKPWWLIQAGFKLNKGSPPPRTDVERSQFDACAQAGFKSATNPDLQVATVNMYFTPK